MNFSWTALQKGRLEKVQGVLEELREYAPLTLRQIFYQMVSREYLRNTVTQYQALSRLLKYARIDGKVSWDMVEDRIRVVHEAMGWNDKNHFLGQVEDQLLKGYRRHLVQDQEKFIEVWIEKDALATLFQKIAHPYCISTVVCRGFSSVSLLHSYANRVRWHRVEQKKKPVMLFFGDFDPSGNEMLAAMGRTLEEMNVYDIQFERVALSMEDIEEYDLPHNPSALKHSDSRAAKHVEEHGEVAVELDALPPNVLEEKIRKAIDGHIDIDALNAQWWEQDLELDELTNLRDKVLAFIEENNVE